MSSSMPISVPLSITSNPSRQNTRRASEERCCCKMQELGEMFGQLAALAALRL